MNNKDSLITIVAIVLFAIIFYGFLISFGSENNASLLLSDSENLQVLNSSLSSGLSTLQSQGESQRENFINEQNPIISFGYIIFSSISGLAQVLVNLPISFAIILSTTGEQLLGIPPIVTNTLLAIFTFSLIIFAWRFLRVGG